MLTAREIAGGGSDFQQESASRFQRLAKEIDLRQVDQLVAAPTEHRLEHEETEAGHLLEPSQLGDVESATWTA